MRKSIEEVMQEMIPVMEFEMIQQRTSAQTVEAYIELRLTSCGFDVSGSNATVQEKMTYWFGAVRMRIAKSEHAIVYNRQLLVVDCDSKSELYKVIIVRHFAPTVYEDGHAVRLGCDEHDTYVVVVTKLPQKEALVIGNYYLVQQVEGQDWQPARAYSVDSFSAPRFKMFDGRMSIVPSNCHDYRTLIMPS